MAVRAAGLLSGVPNVNFQLTDAHPSANATAVDAVFRLSYSQKKVSVMSSNIEI